jgi:Na+(H+)/acetate symporter ActP
MFQTGLAQKIGIGIVKISGTKESSLMFGIMVVSAALSSCLSNTGTAACLMPVVLGICAAAFLPAYFCALYWRRATRQGVMASLWIGTIGSLFALAFLHQKEAAAMGVCRWLFGKDVLIEAYPFPMIDPILFALPLSVAAVIIVSLLTEKGKK